MNDDEAERKTMMTRPTPARAKTAGPLPSPHSARPGPTPPPPLDELLRARKAQLPFDEDEPKTDVVLRRVDHEGVDPFAAAKEIMRILRPLPPAMRKQVVGFIAEMLLEP